MNPPAASTAILADIRRLTLHDGPGTRDTVFLKGCPLRCLWCHNPESISAVPQLLYRSRLCTGCGDCARICTAGVHLLPEGGEHTLNTALCRSCWRCAENCLGGALTWCGKTVTPEEVFSEVMKEQEFFIQSEGGVTLSGGEPLLYPLFAGALFRMLRQHGIHTALDTCGQVPAAAFEAVLPWTSMILYDLKGMDEENHRRNTGCGNREILANLARLGKGGVPVEIRMPIIPEHNDAPEEIAAAGKFLSALPAVTAIRLLPYHSLARNKYAFCGRHDTMPRVAPPSPEHLQELADILLHASGKPVLLPDG